MPADPEHPDHPEHPDARGGAVLDAVCAAAGSLLERASGVARVRVRCGDVSVELRWPAAPAAPELTTGSAAQTTVVGGDVTVAEPADVAYVRSPMVGTFYHAPGPDAPPFVQVGDEVEVGQQVGILEAMKLMNPVEAERPGRVVEVLVPDATAVEYDQRLIAITAPDPAG